MPKTMTLPLVGFVRAMTSTPAELDHLTSRERSNHFNTLTSNAAASSTRGFRRQIKFFKQPAHPQDRQGGFGGEHRRRDRRAEWHSDHHAETEKNVQEEKHQSEQHGRRHEGETEDQHRAQHENQ